VLIRPQRFSSGARAPTCPFATLLGEKANTIHLLSLLYYSFFNLKPNEHTNLELHALKVLFH